MVRKTTILLVLVAVASAMAQRYRGPFDDDDDYGYVGSVDRDSYGPRYGRFGPSDYRRGRGRGGSSSDSSDSSSDSSDSDSDSDSDEAGDDFYGFWASLFGPSPSDIARRRGSRLSYGRPSFGSVGPSPYDDYDRSDEDDQEISNHILTQ